jgi:hypothetical protein
MCSTIFVNIFNTPEEQRKCGWRLGPNTREVDFEGCTISDSIKEVAVRMTRCGSVGAARMVSNLEIVEQNKQAKKIARTAPDTLHSKKKAP